MRTRRLAAGVAIIAAMGVLAAGSATAATGDTINGTLAFGPDGAYGGQYWSPSTITDPGTFFYADSANIDTASFANGVLTITDDVLSNANGWEQTYTDVTSPFTELTLLSSNFTPGLTYNFSGGTLTVDWQGTTDTLGQLTATFAVGGGVPEPASWLLMIAGVGGIGMMARRAKKSAAVA